jgi:hypothetical protein
MMRRATVAAKGHGSGFYYGVAGRHGNVGGSELVDGDGDVDGEWLVVISDLVWQTLIWRENLRKILNGTIKSGKILNESGKFGKDTLRRKNFNETDEVCGERSTLEDDGLVHFRPPSRFR